MGWLALLPLAAPLIFNAGANTETRVRAPGDVSGEERAARAYDWSIQGQSSLTTAIRRNELRLSYSPYFAVNSFTLPGRRLELAHSIFAAYLMPGSHSQTTLSAGTNVGYRSFSILTNTGVAATFNGQVLPPVTIGFLSSDARVAHDRMVGLRHNVNVGAGFRYNRALDDESAPLVPTSYGPDARAAYAYSVTRRDRVGLLTTATQIETKLPVVLGVRPEPPWVKVTTVQSMLTWSRELASEKSLTGLTQETATIGVSAGVSISHVETPDEKHWEPVVFIANANLNGILGEQHEFNFGGYGTLAASASVSVATFIDQFTGEPDQRVSGLAGLTWTKRPVQVYLNVGATRSIDARFRFGASQVYGELGARTAVTKHVYATAGVRAARQLTGDPADDVGVDRELQLAAFIGAGVYLDPLTF